MSGLDRREGTTNRPVRIALLVADALVALTAVGGGIALAVGLEGSRFPIAWLAGTPFDSYVAPGVFLAVAVGTSAAFATIAAVVRPRLAGPASIVAGVVLLAWILGEIVILTADDELVSPTELLYVAVGLVMVGLGFAFDRLGRRSAAPGGIAPARGAARR